MGIDLILLGVSMLIKDSHFEVILVSLFSVIFGLSHGPVFWQYITETMTPEGVSLASLGHWMSAILISISTPLLFDLINGYLFIIFGILMIIWSVISFFFMQKSPPASSRPLPSLEK
mmetsp:Transcript_38381/g.36746  ORF Transcript_38381/g.36746 Transcript_38381/m.36746 type:complete len:117 (+) Transcript_38381:186-536(+)